MKGRKKAVRRVTTLKITQRGAKLGGGKLKGCTGEKGRATPPNLDKIRKSSTNP
jgi:hypothetical protein